MRSIFADRRQAGQALAFALREHSGCADLAVLALPRGGVPVAYEVARQLGAPLDVFVVRKLGVPGHEELAMGALASGGLCVLNADVVDALNISKETILYAARAEVHELERRERAYRGEQLPLELSGKRIIVVDDGLATGSTMRAAIRALRQRNPERIIGAVPIAAPDTCAEMKEEADDMVCAVTPQRFHAVGLWYEHFAQTTDEEVRALLDASRREHPRGGAASIESSP
jgi:putative phosphoribosyl transferase